MVKSGKAGKSDGSDNAEACFRGIVPILRFLRKLHEDGSLYGSLTPDDVEVMEGGRFRICRFPAGDEKAGRDGLSDAYTAPERLENGAAEGPWSDLYSVTAVLYHALTGRDPESAYERVLGEKLTLPEDLGMKMDPALKHILVRGLAIAKEDRYRSAEEMLKDIEAVFPEKEQAEKRKRKRRLIFRALGAVAASALIAALGLCEYFYPEKLQFHGQETELIWLKAPEKADRKTLAGDWRRVERKVRACVGKDGYIWRFRGGDVRLVLPSSTLSASDRRKTDLSRLLLPDHLEHKIRINAEQKVRWENPDDKGSPTGYQVRPSEAISHPILLIYRTDRTSVRDNAGIRAQKFEEFKARLNVLKTPYCMGVLKDRPYDIAVRIDRRRIPEFYAKALDYEATLDLFSSWSCMSTPGLKKVEPYRRQDGKQGICLLCDFDQEGSERLEEAIRGKMRRAQKAGNRKIGLQAGEMTVAQGDLQEIEKELKNGRLYFPDVLIPETKDGDLPMICRCLNRMNREDLSSEHDYSLAEAQDVDGEGKPVRRQEGLSAGQLTFLTDGERTYVKELADEQDVFGEIVESVKRREINFSDEKSAGKGQKGADATASGNEKSQFAAAAMTRRRILCRKHLHTQKLGIFFGIRSVSI